jgi:tetratricopeptide (TPR) repeat protein
MALYRRRISVVCGNFTVLCLSVLAVVLLGIPSLVSAAQPVPGNYSPVPPPHKERPRIASGVLAGIEPENANWEGIDDRIGRTLLTLDRAALIKELAKQPNSLAVSLAQLDVHMRAGNREAARKFLLQVCKNKHFTTVNNNDQDKPGSLFSYLIYKKEWELARQMILHCPLQNTNSSHTLIRYISQTQGDTAAEKILEWQARQGNDSWLSAWIEFRKSRGGSAQLLKKLETELRAAPDSYTAAHRYIRAVNADRRYTAGDEDVYTQRLAWLGDFCKPARALDSYNLGTDFLNANLPKTAAVFYERSLTLPLTQPELREMASGMQMMVPHLDLAFRRWTRQHLIRAYQAAGDTERARQHVEKLAQDEQASGILTAETARMAGAIPTRAGEDPVKTDLLHDEQADANSPEYWLARANYFAGRKEDAPARAAYEKAIALAPVATGIQGGKVPMTIRLRALFGYTNYLAPTDKEAAIQLLRTQLARQDQEDWERGEILRQLLHRYQEAQQAISPDDELLWTVITQKARWNYDEGRILSEMLVVEEPGKKIFAAPAAGKPLVLPKPAAPQHTPQQVAVVERAEKLSEGADPSRAEVLGEVCMQRGFPEKAIALFIQALPQEPDKYIQQDIRRKLFDLYINQGAPQSAEGYLPETTKEVAAAALLSDYASLAKAFAPTNSERAMYYWRKVNNIDATYIYPIGAMSRTSTVSDLRKFYQAQRISDPQSWVTHVVLEKLNQPIETANWSEYRPD